MLILVALFIIARKASQMHVALHSRSFTLTHCRSCLCKAPATTGGTHSPARHSHMANDSWQNTDTLLSSVSIPAAIQSEIPPLVLKSKMLHNSDVDFCPVNCKHSAFYFITDALKLTSLLLSGFLNKIFLCEFSFLVYKVVLVNSLWKL